jgi:hypothetical protein
MSIINLQEKIKHITETCSDINEHIPTLMKYARECNHITEMGVRWIVSTWAFLATSPDKLISYDILDPSSWDRNANIQDVYDTAEKNHLNFQFIQANVLNIKIEITDLLFLDTWHAYKQLKSELALHSNKVRKYIILHDTTTYAEKDERSYEVWGADWQGDGKGIWPAIEEFLHVNQTWELLERFTNNNGLTVLKRI